MAGSAADGLLSVLGAWELHPGPAVVRALGKAGPVMAACLAESDAWGALQDSGRTAVVLGMLVSNQYSGRSKVLNSGHAALDVPMVGRGLALARVARVQSGQVVLPRAAVRAEAEADVCALKFAALPPYWQVEAMRMILSGGDVVMVVDKLSALDIFHQTASEATGWVTMLEGEPSESGGLSGFQAALRQVGLLPIRSTGGQREDSYDWTLRHRSEVFHEAARMLVGELPSERELMGKIFGPDWETEFGRLDLDERPAEE